MTEDDFWKGIEPEDIVAPEQRETAVYMNDCDGIVIRQRNILGEDDDVVVIRKQHIDALIARLNRLKG